MSTTHDEIVKLADAWENVLKPRITRIEDRLDENELVQIKSREQGGRQPVQGTAPFLGLEQKAAKHFECETVDYNAKNVRLGALLAAYANFEGTKNLLNEDERKAYSAVIDPTGGLLIPTVIGREFIDAVRPKTQVLAAGARTYPMEAAHVILPGWADPPVASWRGPTGTFADAGGDFRAVSLNAQDVGGYVDVENNVFEDAGGDFDGVSQIIEDQLQRAIAQAIDLAALLSQDAITGGGTHVPMGLASLNEDGEVAANYGITLATSSGANGGPPTNYDWHIDAAAAVYGGNFTPTAHLAAPRTLATLAKLKETGTGAYMRKPEYLDGVRDFPTAQIGVAYPKGTSEDTSVSFVGDFSRMVIGVRGGLSVLRDPFTQGTSAMTRLIVRARADVAVLDAPAFLILSGLRP